MYRKQFRNKIPRPGKCPFCQSKTSPDYKKADDLQRFVSERGKIVSRSRSGICSKHQRKLALGIKRARHLGLLPFVTRV